MDTRTCLNCEHSQDKYDQYGAKYCYCFHNKDKGRWVAEIETCPKVKNNNGNNSKFN